MRILVVEDETELRELLGRALRRRNFAVDLAADGIDGLHYATEYPVDLAIIDLGLPGNSGMDIVRQVREQGRKYPILFLTARSDCHVKLEVQASGANASST